MGIVVNMIMIARVFLTKKKPHKYKTCLVIVVSKLECHKGTLDSGIVAK